MSSCLAVLATPPVAPRKVLKTGSLTGERPPFATRLPWIEQRAEALRRALDLTGMLFEADLERLLEWLDEATQPGLEQVLLARKTGLPLGEALSEEVALAAAPFENQVLDRAGLSAFADRLLRSGGAEMLRQQAVFGESNAAAAGPLAARARQFAIALLLPGWMLREVADDGWLAWNCNCTRELVRWRRKLLPDAYTELSDLPDWCAAHKYHAVLRAKPAAPRLYVVRRGSAQPVLRLPVGIRPQADAVMERLLRHLVALTVEEFEWKYGLCRR